MTEYNPYTAPATSAAVSQINNQEIQPRRPTRVFVFIILNLLVDLMLVSKALEKSSNYYALSSKQFYMLFWDSLVILVLHSLLIVFWIVSLILLHRKKQSFKSFFKMTMIINLCISFAFPSSSFYGGVPILATYLYSTDAIISIIAQGLGGVLFLSIYTFMIYRYIKSAEFQVDFTHIDSPQISGLGGWLVFLAITMGIYILFTSILIFSMISIINANSSKWQLFSDPMSIHYVAGLKFIIYWQLATYTLIVCGWLLAAVLFFSKKKLFKNYFISLAIISPIMVFIAYLFLSMISPDGLLMAFIVSALPYIFLNGIWIAYLLKSRRVANTFVS